MLTPVALSTYKGELFNLPKNIYISLYPVHNLTLFCHIAQTSLVGQ